MKTMMRTVLVTAVSLLLLSGIVVAAAPSFEVVHENDQHEGTMTDIEIDTRHQVAFSLDQEGGFAAYDIEAGEVEFYHQFERRAHELALGEDVVYVAVSNTLWVLNLTDGELSEFTKLEDHAGGLEYDADRDVIWVGGGTTVTGFNADDGSEFMEFETGHTDPIGTMAFNGDHIATGTTFHNEVVVYNIEADEVVFEPELPDDAKFIGALDLTDSGGLIVGASAEEGDVVAAYEIESQEKQLQYRKHIFGISHVEYVESEEVIVSTGGDNTIKVYDVNQEAVVEQHKHDDTIFTAEVDLHNELIWIGDGGENETGTLLGLDVSTDEPTPTPTAVETTDTDEPDQETPTPTQLTTTEPVTEPSVTDTEGQPGFGVAAAVSALLAAVVLASRRRL